MSRAKFDKKISGKEMDQGRAKQGKELFSQSFQGVRSKTKVTQKQGVLPFRRMAERFLRS
ncbi:MAG: hypothetical protein SCI25_12645 [Desulfuromonadales bacterium]|nr:hypothetical protein [Desulfuromonadales bacterium]